MLKAICSCLLCQEKKQFCSQVILESYFQLADSDRCVAESKGGLLHELFHVFGVGVVTIRSFLRLMITIKGSTKKMVFFRNIFLIGGGRGFQGPLLFGHEIHIFIP